MNDPKVSLLTRAASILVKVAAPILWKYTDEEGKFFYLPEKQVGTLRSPFSGKSFTSKPERTSLGEVGKQLKEEDAKVKGSLWKYVDGDEKEFYLAERITGTLKSPYTGKSFKPSAEKLTLGDVGKDLKEGDQIEKEASTLRVAAPVLWKYVDEEGKGFYLTEKKVGTLRSPFSGKSFTGKPERTSLGDVGKDLKEEDAKVKGSLWKYVDGDGNEFFLSERITGSLKSPYTGKTFKPSAEKLTLGDVSKDLKEEAKIEKEASLVDSDKKVIDAFFEKKKAEGKTLNTDGKTLDREGLGGKYLAKWEGDRIVVNPDRPMVKSDEESLRYMKKSIPANMIAPHPFFSPPKKASVDRCEVAAEILERGENHPALMKLRVRYDRVLTELRKGKKDSDGYKGVGVGITEDPHIVLGSVYPAIVDLAREAEIVARQIKERLT